MLLFRPSRPDFIETSQAGLTCWNGISLFRPSRPDFIETLLLLAGATSGALIVPAF